MIRSEKPSLVICAPENFRRERASLKRRLRRSFEIVEVASPFELERTAWSVRCAIAVGDELVRKTLDLTALRRSPRRFVLAVTNEARASYGAAGIPKGVSVMDARDVHTMEPLRRACLSSLDTLFAEAHAAAVRSPNLVSCQPLQSIILSLLEDPDGKPMRHVEGLARKMDLSKSGFRGIWHRTLSSAAPEPGEFLEMLRFLALLKVWIGRGSLKRAARHAGISQPTARGYVCKFLGALPSELDLGVVPLALYRMEQAIIGWLTAQL